MSDTGQTFRSKRFLHLPNVPATSSRMLTCTAVPRTPDKDGFAFLWHAHTTNLLIAGRDDPSRYRSRLRRN